jgi:5'-methylthioadenosine phosphorylase
MIKIGIIGGKGLNKPDYLKNIREIEINTPFGKAGPLIYSGQYNSLEIIYFQRQGEDQSIPPIKINFKANLHAMKQFGCNYILATSTCESLQEEICPGDIIIPDQFIDMTKQIILGTDEELHNENSHCISMAEPFSEDLRNHFIESAIVKGITVHTKGTVIAIDGQRTSSRAESNLYRKWGADVINMTSVPEVILANKLQIPYATLSLCTCYDSWRLNEQAFDLNDIITKNGDKIGQILHHALKKLQEE